MKIRIIVLFTLLSIYCKSQNFNGFALYNAQGSNTTYLIDENQNIAHTWNLNTECNYTVLLKKNGNLVRGTKRNGNIWEVQLMLVEFKKLLLMVQLYGL